MDSLAIIKNAKEVLAALDTAKAEEHSFDLEAKQLKKRLDAEMQMVSDSIRRTVTERRDEIVEDYRKESVKVQERQKKVRTQRNKAKAVGVKNRIEEETADLWEENRRLKRELNSRMKKDKVPSFCNTTYYYALYFTKGWKEILLLIATFAAAIFVIPCGIYWLIPGRKVVHLVVIYIVAVIVFFGGYVLVGNLTKDRYIRTLKEGRKIRDVIVNNRRRIRTITRSIEKDQDDQAYQLEDYDQRLELLTDELQDIERRKESALRQFDNVTEKKIAEEIQANSQAQIDELNEGIAQAEEMCEQRQALIKSLNLKITDEYMPYLGKEFLEPTALDGLAKLIMSGEAANLTEAKTLYAERKNNR